MAEEKKNSTNETEINTTEDKKADTLEALSFDDGDVGGDEESSDTDDFASFMADFRGLFGKKKDDNDATLDDQSEIEEEKPEDVLISLPKKRQEQDSGEEKAREKQTNPDWNDQITLEPEEYDDPYEDDKDMTEEIAEENDSEVELGEITEESDSSFQISINFDGEDITEPSNDEEDEPKSKYNPEKPRVMDWVFDVAEMFVFVLAVVILLTSFIFRHSIVDGQSMMNTLEHGDHLIISDLFYTPERGDIIVFEDYSTSLRKAVVKRVIGLPGETVEVRMNDLGDIVVYINGELLDEDYAYNAKDCYVDKSSFNKPIVVEENEIFVMGDNRYHSTDSRTSSVGTISIDSILGKAILRFLPFDKFGILD